MLDERIKKLEQEKQVALLELAQLDLPIEERKRANEFIDKTHEGLIMHINVLYKAGFKIEPDLKEDQNLYDENETYRCFINRINNHRIRIAKIVKILEEGKTVADYFICR